VYQLGEEGPIVGAISNQHSDVRNQFVLPLRRLTAVSMKCACHPKSMVIRCVIFSYTSIINHFIRDPKRYPGIIPLLAIDNPLIIIQ